MSNWVSVCELNDITPGTGVCALHNGEQVAIFRVTDDEQLYAINNFDPFSQANVLSRGITGSLGGRVVVASPMYKQHFDLSNGECLEYADKSVKTYPVRVSAGMVELG
jgi:nitrite reductase (NADH) small subunit